MKTRTALAAIASLLAAGCIGVPNPLAPSVGGSVGSPSRGVLTGAASLPRSGPGFFRVHDNDVHFGIPRLVGALTRAAATVDAERPHGPRLAIGDLSKKFGGKAEGHSSHRSGRDADVLYFVTTPAGVPIESPGFVRFGPDGLAEEPKKHSFVRLDTERTWLFIRALLEDPSAQVQWIFMARPLEALVIEQARALGEDPELIWYAETVLKQPSDSAAHDDHMHVRLACTPDDAVAGCEGGPRWPFLSPLPELSATEDEEVLALLEP